MKLYGGSVVPWATMHLEARFGLAFSLPLVLVGCGKAPPAPEDKPIPASAVASVAAPPPSKDATTLSAKSVKATFLIDAPLEKIKGVSTEGDGNVSLVPGDLAKTTGVLRIKLSTLRTETFGDKSKDESQTAHARAWMEVSSESAEATRHANEYAVFTLQGLKVSPNELSAMKDENGERKANVTAIGNLKLHGVTVRREITLLATFAGPKDAPTAISFKTEAPFAISLKEHDIKPRDGLGKFLDGALEKVGKKIDDKVQLSVDASFARLRFRQALERISNGAPPSLFTEQIRRCVACVHPAQLGARPQLVQPSHALCRDVPVAIPRDQDGGIAATGERLPAERGGVEHLGQLRPCPIE